jgi:hypothetical protein
LIFLFSNSFSQNLNTNFESIIRLIPIESFPEVTESGLDSLLKFHYYEVPGGDENESTAYEFQVMSEKCAALVWYFTTGQRGYKRIEISAVDYGLDSQLVILCMYSGAALISQSDIEFFTFQNDQLQRSKKSFLPSKNELDSLLDLRNSQSMKELDDELEGFYSISCEPFHIEYSIDSYGSSINSSELMPIIFRWNGEVFLQKE